MILQIKPFIGLSVLFLSVFFSCGQTKKTEGLEVIPIEAAYLHPTTLKASDYFRKIRYVPLETNDHALVGSDPVVWISGKAAQSVGGGCQSENATKALCTL